MYFFWALSQPAPILQTRTQERSSTRAHQVHSISNQNAANPQESSIHKHEVSLPMECLPDSPASLPSQLLQRARLLCQPKSAHRLLDWADSRCFAFTLLQILPMELCFSSICGRRYSRSPDIKSGPSATSLVTKIDTKQELHR